MSGSTIGGIAGAAIGFFIPGIGPALGASIGSFIGGIVKPPTINAPSIGDAQRQVSALGWPIPVVYGHPAPFRGNLIDGETEARKITVKTKQGKGGPTVKEDKFLLTSAILVCEGEIDYLRIWEDEVVVYDARPPEMLPPGWEGYSDEQQAVQAKWLGRARMYRGDQTQLPDPALEAIHGVGNTLAYRGRAYIVVEDVDRTLTKGTAAIYKFEVTEGATLTQTEGTMLDLDPGFYYPLQGDGDDVMGGLATLVPGGDYEWGGEGIQFNSNPANAGISQGSGVDGAAEFTISCTVKLDAADSGSFAGHFTNTSLGWYNWVFAHADRYLWIGVNGGSGSGDTIFSPTQVDLGDAVVVTLRKSTSLLELFIDGAFVDSVAAGGTPGGTGTFLVGSAGDPGFIGSVGELVGFTRALSDEEILREVALAGKVPAGFVPMPDAEGVYYNPITGQMISAAPSNSVTLGSTDLESVESDIAQRCNVPAGKIDYSALAVYTIPGFLVARQESGKDVVSPLTLAFFHDLIDVDGMQVARLRAGPVDWEITFDDLLAGSSDPLVRPQRIEYPERVSIVTQDPDADYPPDGIPQTSFRRTPSVGRSTGELTIPLAVPLKATPAKQIAEKVHQLLISQAEGEIVLQLPSDFMTMVASDTLTFDNRRWLVTKTDWADGVMRVEGVYERTENYESTAEGTPPPTPTPPNSNVLGPTRFIAMNLPQLRPQDNSTGVYIAVQGMTSGWRGADIWLSTDGGLTENLVATITRASIMGALVDDEPSGGEPITVGLYDSSDELENVTAGQVAQGQNAATIVDAADAAEIVGFETAVQNTSGHWELSNITRGGLGTTEATHLTGERFVMLDQVTFLPISAEFAGQTLIFRAVSIGTPVDANATTSLVFSPHETIIDAGEIE